MQNDASLWDMILGFMVAIIGFFARGKMSEVDRLSILLNKTREEVARESVTRAEFERTVERVLERVDHGVARLEDKIDDLRKSHSGG
jgi:hypothetical protein